MYGDLGLALAACEVLAESVGLHAAAGGVMRAKTLEQEVVRLTGASEALKRELHAEQSNSEKLVYLLNERWEVSMPCVRLWTVSLL